ncbi:uncharacterized protein LOC132714134 isoform X3 [Ruditapes philippinarum]|uniref:uncharacterized protein LOC132714134 isoform X3 n=1 Tax=Ruditapes philippinarum TaxID=129788 RepID=UPI00295BBA64|nr:uncharacterized protein LOC132714134 isoform X3 [Ruditapes philippinarum]
MAGTQELVGAALEIPVPQTKRKRRHSEAGIDTGDEDDDVESKYKRHHVEIDKIQTSDSPQLSPLKKIVSDNTVATSPQADSGYEISAVNTPSSSKPWKYVQPGSSGYISGSDCGTPAGSQRTPGPFSPDFVTRGKKTIAPVRPRHLEYFLQRQFVVLKSEVDPSGVADSLFTDGILSENDVEKIREEKFRFDKCDILIKSIVRSKLKNDIHTPRKVITAFEKEGYGHLFQDFEKGKEKRKTPPVEEVLSKEDIKGRFFCNSAYIEDEIDPLLILDDLVAEEVLTFDEHQDIKNTDFKPKKVENLIKYILRKSVSDFWLFCKALEVHYPSLAELLRRGASGPSLTEYRTTPLIDVTCVKKPTETSYSNCPVNEVGSREETEVKIIFSGDGREEEQMIVDDNFPDVDFGFQEEAMEIGFDISRIQFSCIRISLTNMSKQSQMMLLKKCRESPKFLEKWIQSMISEKHIQRLQEKNIDKISFQVKLCLPDLDKRTCSCKLTKEAIVEHYTSLEKNLKCVKEIIQTFGKFEGFDEETRAVFQNLLAKDKTGPIIERFLQKMLDLHDSRIHLCLLEKEMRTTNPTLLEEVIKSKPKNTTTKLSVSDLRRNMNFLVDELEPRHFRELLIGIDGSEVVVEKVMSTEPRKERCRELLNFIIQKKNIDRFVQELERRNKTHIVEFLMASKQDSVGCRDDLKEAIVINYKRIIDEIEPRAFRQMFVERREIKAKDYDAIMKLQSRRHRAVCLMGNILKRNGSTWKCFVDSLEVMGYKHLVKLINSTAGSYVECPRLYQSLIGRHRFVTLEGEFQLKFTKGEIKESTLQVFLLKSIYASDSKEKENNPKTDEEINNELPSSSCDEVIVKRNLTRAWVQEQQMDLKRKHNDLDAAERSDIEQPTESKQPRPEVAYAIQDFAELSQASSPMLGVPRHGDYCSSPPLTRSSSRESDERPQYEDISPPASPSHEDKPHIIIEAPCFQSNMFHLKRRNSLSDGSSCTSSPSTSPSCFRGACLIKSSEQNFSSRPYRSLSAIRDSVNGRVNALFSSIIKKGK